MPSSHLQLMYMPYLSLAGTDELSFGDVVVWNADKCLDRKIADPRLRKRVDSLLAMNTVTVRGHRRVRVRGMGVVGVGANDLRVLLPSEIRRVRELRTILFACRLSENALLSPNNLNGGHYLITAENFVLVSQDFSRTGEYIAERSGNIIEVMNMGYRISSTRFPMPSYINQPLQFTYDSTLLAQLAWLRTQNRPLFNRIIRATEVFLESYYNSSSVPIQARILLQALALEILLDLPESNQRMHLKERIEKYCNEANERRLRYSYKHGSKTSFELRTVKVLWADRFYQLRNHIIHGAVVRPSEYKFRHAQHHFSIATKFFVLTLKRLIDEQRTEKGLKRAFVDRIDWTKWEDPLDANGSGVGFVLSQDWFKVWLNGN